MTCFHLGPLLFFSLRCAGSSLNGNDEGQWARKGPFFARISSEKGQSSDGIFDPRLQLALLDVLGYELYQIQFNPSVNHGYKQSKHAALCPNYLPTV